MSERKHGFTLRSDDVAADIQQLRERMPTLEAVERRRGQLWSVAGLFLLVASVAVLLLMAAPQSVDAIPDNPAVRGGFVAMSAAFMLYVFDQERRMRRLSRALVDERVLSAALKSRVFDLATLSRVGQIVNSAIRTEEVLGIILEGAFELTGAVTGSVMLAEDDALVVAVSAGEDPAPVGSRQPLGTGVAGRVATTLEPLLINGRVGEAQVSNRMSRLRSPSSSIVAPMLVSDELVGILAIERAPDASEFSEWDLRAIALFASHAATAVMNARRYESERSNVERLADMLERRAEYVATLVHDLKAPLSAIIGFNKLLQTRSEQMGVAGRAQAMERVDSASERLLSMVDDILRGATVEAGATVRPEAIEARALADELADMARNIARGREENDREIVVEGDQQLTLHTDRGALRSVLLNLLDNAIKYSPPDTPIRLAVLASEDEIRFEVTDHGKGIPEAEQEIIFERFRQKRDGDSIEGGVGLGLYIVRSLVTAQGGRIWLESASGKGSTFHVAFPRRHRVVTGPAPAAKTAASSAAGTVVSAPPNEGSPA